MTKRATDVWNEVSEPAQTDQELRWQEAISLALYADDTLPTKRSEENHDKHLRFVRFLVSLPLEGVELVISREKGSSTLTSYCQSAVVNGWLSQEYDQKTGKRIITPSDKLDHLLVLLSKEAA